MKHLCSRDQPIFVNAVEFDTLSHENAKNAGTLFSSVPPPIITKTLKTPSPSWQCQGARRSRWKKGGLASTCISTRSTWSVALHRSDTCFGFATGVIILNKSTTTKKGGGAGGLCHTFPFWGGGSKGTPPPLCFFLCVPPSLFLTRFI